ncbi:alpha/beta hydrolase family protein (macronuclear) [Tetrahymena thermophila SB210]|uniref:Alpha/beta hydrolase family protein n=1 Tax=Tetrahymena thermophila (strain SB210) TaxID=312017 RepID=Q23H38_TETTS|nr:alpha/beta hydrolase family protein [Tetrahymena thermophila SB210]EAR95809.2 alpha/beta hydrolase family protein [Tetrahymena thermophila SB210]|eukprot:XP_001016054.2 alpha/beta hydrolase family protein [Tetrahymena thermophila SB210]
MIGQFNQLWKMFIRPQRMEYSTSDLGHETQVFGRYRSKRTDQVILNKRNLKLQCSLFEPILIGQQQGNEENKFHCVIYCHCNSGSRIEALRLLPNLISRGIGLFCFDFSGSGLSEGEYVTLGINESQDLECIVQNLLDSGKINNIVLWGRSMGAVTSMMYLSKRQTQRVKGIVFDSGFANLNFLALDVARQKTGMPNLVLDIAISQVRDQVKERVPIDIQEIDLTKVITNIYIPCYFICSKEDTFVKCEHSEQLYARYNGQKWLEYVSGNHNAQRTNDIIDKIIRWVDESILNKDQSSSSYNAMLKNCNTTMTTNIDLTQENVSQNRKQSGAAQPIKIINSSSNSNIQKIVMTQSPNPRNSYNDRSVSPIKTQVDNIPVRNSIQQSLDVNRIGQAFQINQQQQQQLPQRGVQQIIGMQQDQQQIKMLADFNNQAPQQQAKIEKERQSQLPESNSSQSRIPTEETSSRNENNESTNGFANIQNANNKQNIQNQHAYSFLSNINEDVQSNDRISSTPIRNKEFEESPRQKMHNRRQDSQQFTQQSVQQTLLSNYGSNNPHHSHHHQHHISQNFNASNAIGSGQLEIEYQSGDIPPRRSANQNFNSFQVPYNTSQDFTDQPFPQQKRQSVQNILPIQVQKFENKQSKDGSLVGTPQFKPDQKSSFAPTNQIDLASYKNNEQSPNIPNDGKSDEVSSYGSTQSSNGNKFNYKVRQPSQFSALQIQQTNQQSTRSSNNETTEQNNKLQTQMNTTPPRKTEKSSVVQSSLQGLQHQQPQKFTVTSQGQQISYQLIHPSKNMSTQNLHEQPHQINPITIQGLNNQTIQNTKEDQEKSGKNASNSNTPSQRQVRSSTCNGAILSNKQEQQPSSNSKNASQNLIPNQLHNYNPQSKNAHIPTRERQLNNFTQQITDFSSSNTNPNNPPLVTLNLKTVGNEPLTPKQQKTQQNLNQQQGAQYQQMSSNQNFLNLQMPFFSSYTGPINTQPQVSQGQLPPQQQSIQKNVNIQVPQQISQQLQANITNSPSHQQNQQQQIHFRSRGLNGSIDATNIQSQAIQMNSLNNNLLVPHQQKPVNAMKPPLSPEKTRGEQLQQQQLIQQQQQQQIQQQQQQIFQQQQQVPQQQQFVLQQQQQQQQQMQQQQQQQPQIIQQNQQQQQQKQEQILQQQQQQQNQSISVKSIVQQTSSNNVVPKAGINLNQFNSLPQNVNQIMNQQSTPNNTQIEKKQGLTHIPVANISISANQNNTQRITSNIQMNNNISNNNNNSNTTATQYSNNTSNENTSRKSTEASNYSSSNASEINYIKYNSPNQMNNLNQINNYQQYNIDSYNSNQGNNTNRKYSENNAQNYKLIINTNQPQYSDQQIQSPQFPSQNQTSNNANLQLSSQDENRGSSSNLQQQQINIQPSSTKNTTFSMPNKMFSTYDTAFSYKNDDFNRKKSSNNLIDFMESNQQAFSTHNQLGIGSLGGVPTTPKGSSQSNYRVDTLFKDTSMQYKQSQQNIPRHTGNK